MIAPRRNFVADMTWEVVAERLNDGAFAILPIGAGAKQHGMHMPMATDRIQAEYFAESLTENIDGIVWPTVTYGHYPAFVAYAGSVSISSSTFEALVGEIARGIAEFGAREIIILNTGLSTIAPIDKVLSRTSIRARHLKVYSGPRLSQAVKTVGSQSHGSHADEIETSIMLAIAPDLIDMTRAADSAPLLGNTSIGPLSPTNAGSKNFSASGSFGQPSLASLEKGRAFVRAILDDLLDGLPATTP